MKLVDRQRLSRLAAGLLLVVVALGNIIFLHDFFTARFPGGNDSIPRWVGSLAWFSEGLNPYSDEVTDRAQEMIYGRRARPEEDKQRFVYPFYTVFFYLPLLWLNYEWARAVGMVLLEVSLILTTIVSLRMYQWKPPSWLLALTVIWAVIFYHGARTIILWQMAGVVAVLIAVGLWAVKERRDVLAGVCLALATIKPQMTFLLLPLLGLWSLSARRWRLAASLAMSMAVLVGGSFLLLPGWLNDMQRQLADYTNYTHIGSPINILTQTVFPFLGQPVEWALVTILTVWLIWEWWGVRRDDGGRFDWVLALTLVATNLIVTRTATTNYVMMLPALIYLFVLAARAYGPKAHLWIALTEIVLLVGMWVVFVVTVQGREEQWPVYLPLPFGLLLGLMMYRRNTIHL
ncbi:MAG: DUF2029 domain-containing protein [Chloroflexi bacterium]|nr:DUF2029 domain-containing protein [Chloroflexota bacterium]